MRLVFFAGLASWWCRCVVLLPLPRARGGARAARFFLVRSLLPASGFAVLGRGGGEKNPPGSPCLPTYLAAGGSVKKSGVPLAETGTKIAGSGRCANDEDARFISASTPKRFDFPGNRDVVTTVTFYLSGPPPRARNRIEYIIGQGLGLVTLF